MSQMRQGSWYVSSPISNFCISNGFYMPQKHKMRIFWMHIHNILEVKRHNLTDRQTLDQALMYMRQILSEQLDRRFVLGFVLCGSQLQVVLCDRSGIMITKSSINIHKVRHALSSFIFTTGLWHDQLIGATNIHNNHRCTLPNDGRGIRLGYFDENISLDNPQRNTFIQSWDWFPGTQQPLSHSLDIWCCCTEGGGWEVCFRLCLISYPIWGCLLAFDSNIWSHPVQWTIRSERGSLQLFSHIRSADYVSQT